MTAVQVKGLVIRTVDYKESDRLITIFTEEMGVVTALARGSRTLKSRQLSASMQFCYGSYVLYKRGEYYQIKESELIESFFGIRRSLEHLALAAYVAEVISDVATTEAEPELLRLTLNTLYAISELDYTPEKIKASFEIRCAAIIGFMPDVIACECGERLGNFYFDIMGGYIKCYACNERDILEHREPESPHESHIVAMLTEGAKMALGYCVHSPIEKLFSYKISDSDMSVFARATEEYLTNQLERSFKSLDFYKEVTR